MQSSSPLEITLYSETTMPTVYGEFLVSIYRDNQSDDETVLVSLNLENSESPFVRVHSECITGEVFGSLKCDCRDQLSLSLQEIQKRGAGAVVYLRQEGRGIGLGNKIKAYALQNKGADTIEANHKLGFDTDLRTFDKAALILKDRKLNSIVLNTNNPEKVDSLSEFGIEVVDRVPSLSAVNEHNKDYLETKMKRLGHHLKSLF